MDVSGTARNGRVRLRMTFHRRLDPFAFSGSPRGTDTLTGSVASIPLQRVAYRPDPFTLTLTRVETSGERPPE